MNRMLRFTVWRHSESPSANLCLLPIAAQAPSPVGRKAVARSEAATTAELLGAPCLPSLLGSRADPNSWRTRLQTALTAVAAAVAQHSKGSSQHSAAQKALKGAQEAAQKEVLVRMRSNSRLAAAARGAQLWTPTEDAQLKAFVQKHGVSFRELQHRTALKQMFPGRTPMALWNHYHHSLGPEAAAKREQKSNSRRQLRVDRAAGKVCAGGLRA